MTAGGGTVDLVVHAKSTVDGKFKAKEVAPGTGGLCGGTYVDKAFLEYIRAKFPGIDEYRTTNVDKYCRLMQNWEVRMQ